MSSAKRGDMNTAKIIDQSDLLDITIINFFPGLKLFLVCQNY